jgi:uncharacterized membrane protein
MTRLQARLRPRLLSSAALGLLVYLFLPADWQVNSRRLAAWDIGVLVYLVQAILMAARSSTGEMQKRASLEDESAFVVLGLTVAAAIASLGAIAVELIGIQGSAGGQQVFRLTMAGLTILCSWFFVHTIYAIHYAHEFYGDGGERQGLSFPHENRPDYWDFLYFSFTMGAASQTSDVTVVSRRMRRLVLAHTILAFLFNTTILALAVNVGAGLI